MADHWGPTPPPSPPNPDPPATDWAAAPVPSPLPDWNNVNPSPGTPNVFYPSPGTGPRYSNDTLGGVPEAPTDGTQYGRQNTAWTPIVPGINDAPADGTQYARQDNLWTPVQGGGGGGIEEAPDDGNVYARQSNGWVAMEQPPLGAEVAMSDGAGSVVAPAWLPILYDQVTLGNAVTIQDDTHAIINVDGDAIIEIEAKVLHNWGSSVIFGYSLNDGPVTELGRVKVESNDPVFVRARYERVIHDGEAYSLFISSDFEYAQFSWQEVSVDLLVNNATGISEAPQDGKPYAREDAGWTEVTPAAIGLGNVNNTADVNKPVSISQQSAIDTAFNAAVAKAGGTMTGPLVLSADPVTAMQAATKQYVDANAGGGGGGGLINVQRWEGTSTAPTNGTYTPSPGATSAIALIVGGGGGGGGCAANAAGACSAGGGGAGAAVILLHITSLKASYSVTAGRGGAAGASGGNGGAGGTSILGAHQVGGGWGGYNGPTKTAAAVGGGGSSGGSYTAPGTPDGATILYSPGAPGSQGACFSGTSCVNGAGGASMLAPTQPPVFQPVAGNIFAGVPDGYVGPGGGGPGGASTSTTGYQGSPGGHGLVIVYEYA